MAKIKIDEKEYEFDDLSQEAKNQLQAMQYVDQELLRAQMHIKLRYKPQEMHRWSGTTGSAWR